MIMNQITTIPQKISRQGELVVLPRKQYDILVRAAQSRVRSVHRGINHGLDEALEEVRQGKTIGPFDTVKDLMRSLRGPRVCPECGYEFQGNGFDGVDAHWRAHHENIMSYEEAWPLIKSGTYNYQTQRGKRNF